jgi:hypothetical protein
MRAGTAVLVGLIILSACCVAHAELRFGPWVYFAPYYFPPEGSCNGCPVGPQDFLPKYESPAPPMPSYDPGPPPEPKPPKKGKVKSPVAAGPMPQMMQEPAMQPPPDVMGNMGPQPVIKHSRNTLRPTTGAGELKSNRKAKQR